MCYPTLDFDLSFSGLVLGMDEVGYGPWAGPVVVAGVVVLDPGALRPLEGKVKDSKKLSALKRESLFEELTQSQGLLFETAMASVEEIDRLNIRQATCLAMKRCFEAPKFQKIETLLVDGTLPLKHPWARVCPIVKGDGKSFAIGCASIIAKVTRDRMMDVLHKSFPSYGWDKNKGYGTQLHREGLAQVGLCEHHRKSYKPIQKYLLGG